MLTVEELVIESLYHRLVLVNVRKQGAGGGGSSTAATTSQAGQGNVEDEIDEDAGAAAGDAASSASTSTGESSQGGLGFLVVNAMHPYLKRAYGLTPTFSLNKRLLPALQNNDTSNDDNGNKTESGLAAEQILQDQGIEITEEIQTILNTGEIQLMKTTLRSPELQVDLPPTWMFGPSLSHDLSPQTPEELENLGRPSVLPRGISLDKCDQFSVVRLQDKRDPTGKSVMLVQTNDGLPGHRPDRLEAPSRRQALRGAKLRKTKSVDETGDNERCTYISPTPLPAIASSNMAVFVQENTTEELSDEDAVEQKVNPVSASTSYASRARDNEIDSGIWDMIQGMDSRISTRESTRESTPVVSSLPSNDGNSTKINSNHEKATKETNLLENHEEEEVELSEEPSYKMIGSYKVYNVVDSLQCKVMAIESNGDESNTSQQKTSIGANVEASQQLLPFVDQEPIISKPAAEIIFAIEASETESESTMSSITDIRCEFDQSLPSSPLKALSLGSSPAKSATSQALREIEEEQSEGESEYHTPPSISDYDLKQKVMPQSTWSDRSFDASTPSPPPATCISPTPSTATSEHRLTSTPAPSSRRSSDTYRPRSPRSGYNSPKVNRHSTQTTFPAASASTPASPTLTDHELARRRPTSLSNEDSGISVALRPVPARIVTYRDPMASPDSEVNMAESFMSSDGDDGSVYELDLSYELPDYPRHPDWMSQLPVELHSKSINHLAIPGSHISLAIDRDMRMDMDFSKCNYEMAEFLRKLPNLAIFNNFRGLMKRIWKAWMPKQSLSVPQQLESGVRYLDLRITKLRGAVYAEHGLYTKQLKRYLRDIRDFLDAHPKEIIILHFQTLDQLDKSDKRHLLTTLFQTFGARLARSGVPGCTTLEFLWKNKKQVIVVFPDQDMALLRNHIFYGLVWPDFELVTTMPKNQQVSELQAYLQNETLQNDMSHAIADKKLYVLKAVLSPDMTMVFGDFKYKCMRDLSELETEAVLLDWVRSQAGSKVGGRCNIIALDFVGTGSAVSEILQLNFPKRETVV